MKHILPLLTGLLLAPLAALHTAAIGRTMRVMPLPALLRMAGYRTSTWQGKAHFGAKDTPGENPLNLGIAENTVILFMSDNGSPSQCPRNLPLRGHKLTPYEGGIREPMLVKWPGVTKPASVCRNPVVIEDFFPTILELAGADWRGKTPQAVDGVSFVPPRKRKNTGRPRLCLALPTPLRRPDTVQRHPPGTVEAHLSPCGPAVGAF